jgi:hypothetical protein
MIAQRALRVWAMSTSMDEELDEAQIRRKPTEPVPQALRATLEFVGGCL